MWAKIIRAEEHLAAIKAEVALYGELDPYDLIREFNDEGTECTVRLVILEEPTIRLPLLIGDFAHNLRSALDHLAAWLVARNNGTVTEETTFPIRVDLVNKRGRPWSGPVTITPPVSDEAMAVIEPLQPYHGGDTAARNKLALLRSINNADKHRNLLVASSFMADADVGVFLYGKRLAFQHVTGRFYDGAVFAVYQFTEPIPLSVRNHVQVKAYAHPLVTLSDISLPGRYPVVETLTAILDYVRDEVVRPIEQAEATRGPIL